MFYYQENSFDLAEFLKGLGDPWGGPGSYIKNCWVKTSPWWSVHFQGKPFSITVIHAYAPTTNAKEAGVERFYEDLQDLLD